MKKYLVQISYKTLVYAEDSKLAINQAVGRINGHRLITNLQAEIVPQNDNIVDIDNHLNKENNNE